MSIVHCAMCIAQCCIVLYKEYCFSRIDTKDIEKIHKFETDFTLEYCLLKKEKNSTFYVRQVLQLKSL